MKNFLLFLFLGLVSILNAQTVQIKGAAIGYENKSIELFQIDDYISMRESRISTSKVNEAGRFEFNFDSNEKKKVVIRSNNNVGYLYVQPNGNYEIDFPKSNKYSRTTATGTEVEIGFFNLDSTDINYKILGFQRWVDNFLGTAYHLKSVDASAFAQRLERFRKNVEKAYQKDSSDTYFQTYVKFSMATLDNIPNAAERNQYEKHDFYLKYSPVAYQNDAYMDFFNGFYKNLVPRLSSKTNNSFYQAVIKSSPSLAMNALGGEYTLINRRIREMVMIKALSESYYSGEYPQTNILTMLDSLEKKCLFEQNQIIAKNIKYRLTHLTPGSQAPDFVLNQNGKKTKTILAYRNKYLYLHFIRPDMENAMKELSILKDIYARYKGQVQFVTVYDASIDSEENIKILEALPWDVFATKQGNSIWKKYEVQSFPHYSLIDGTGVVVSNPALSPTPDQEYNTIDKTFFHIKKKALQDRDW